MAKVVSIFYNMDEYIQQVPESARYHIRDLLSCEDIALPRTIKERCKKFAHDVDALQSANISIYQLFGILNLKLSDLDKQDVNTLIQQLRQLLRKHANTEIAPPGNFCNITKDTYIRLCRAYDLSKDPDIVSAKENKGNVSLGAMLEQRIKRAVQKIDNFSILIHVFEALHLVTNEIPLNSEQRGYLLNLINTTIVPADGTHYLLCCFSNNLDSPPLKTQLSPDKSYLKPITNPRILNNFLNILAELAALSTVELDFSDYVYGKELKAKYDRLIPVARANNTLNSEYDNRPSNFNSFIFNNEEPQSLIYLESVKPSKSLYKASSKELGNFLKKLKQCLIEHGFIDPSNLHFIGLNDTVYLADIPVESPYIYFTQNANNISQRKWTFALSTDQILNHHLENFSTYNECSKDVRRLFAKGLKFNNNVKPTPLLLNTVTANIEYRIFVEGMLETITSQERQQSFTWLIQWYHHAVNSNEQKMLNLTNAIQYQANVISYYAFLYPKDVNPNTILDIVTCLPEFYNYSDFKLSDIIFKIAKSLATANPNVTNDTYIINDDEFDETLKKSRINNEQLLSFIFVVKITPTLSKLIKNNVPLTNLKLFYQIAKQLFINIIENNKFDCIRNFLFETLNKNTITDIINNSVSTKRTPTALFNTLKCYENLVLNYFLPPICSYAELEQSVIDKLIDTLNPFLTYINSNSIDITNELAFRIFEQQQTSFSKLPRSLLNFRKELLAQNEITFDNAKHLFNIHTVNRTDCLNIMNACAKILNLTIFPNPSLENYEHVISAYDYICFKSGTLNSPNNIEEIKMDFILPYRLALQVTSSFTVANNLLQNTIRELPKSYDLSPIDNQQISDYLTEITNIKLKKGGNYRCGMKLNKIEFSEIAKERTISWCSIAMSNGDRNTNLRNISTINKRLYGNFLNVLINAYQMPSSTGINNRLTNNNSIAMFNKQTTCATNNNQLDHELIAKMTQETAKVQQLLTPIFSDSSTTESNTENSNVVSSTQNTMNSANVDAPSDLSDIITETGDIKGSSIFNLLPANCQKLLKRLLQLQEFSMQDFQRMCKEEGLMTDGALELVNSWALENFDCTIIEEDEPMFFDKELLVDVLN